MAGGGFSTQNKIRPGAYIKFQGVPSDNNLIGSRGIVALAMPIGWGEEEKIIKITVNDLFNSNLEKLVGFSIYDERAKLIKAALENAHTLLLYRADLGGEKAEVTIELGTAEAAADLKATAKYAGSVGNEISISVTAVLGGYNVNTFLGSVQKDVQFATDLEDLVSNDFVDFSGEGAITKAAVNTLLTTGDDGEFTSSDYTDFLQLIKSEKFDVLAAYDFGDTAFFSGESIKAFIEELREQKGIKCQAVINNYVAANYEGIISINNQGIKYNDDTELSGDEFVVWVAGATAGADVTESNTYKLIPNAVEILNDVLEDNIEGLLAQGYLIVSKKRDGGIVIEKDINTLVTIDESNNIAFKENKTVRLIDAIANKISIDFETNFIGKVNNDETGRALFKSSIISYLTSLQTSGALINFNSATDVKVEAGEQEGAYYSEIFIQPTYAVDKLYMVINVK